MTLGSCFDFPFDILIGTSVVHSLIDTALISHCYFRLDECLDKCHHTHIKVIEKRGCMLSAVESASKKLLR